MIWFRIIQDSGKLMFGGKIKNRSLFSLLPIPDYELTRSILFLRCVKKKKKKKNDNRIQDEILKAIYFIILPGYCKWKLLVYRSISQRLIIVNHDSFPVSAQLTKFRPDTVNEKQIDDRVYNFDSRRSGRD